MVVSKRTRFDVGASVHARAAAPRTTPARAGTLAPTSIMENGLIGHLRNGAGPEAFQKTADFGRLVFWIGGEHDQKKSVLGGEGKARHVENRVVGHGQPVERQHS